MGGYAIRVHNNDFMVICLDKRQWFARIISYTSLKHDYACDKYCKSEGMSRKHDYLITFPKCSDQVSVQSLNISVETISPGGVFVNVGLFIF